MDLLIAIARVRIAGLIWHILRLPVAEFWSALPSRGTRVEVVAVVVLGQAEPGCPRVLFKVKQKELERNEAEQSVHRLLA